MKITFLGAVHEVTGSCTLLRLCEKNILVDCGMEQGADIYENCELPISPTEIDAIVLTHAHIDHSGKIPAMVAGGYKGPIYSTEATFRLCEIMLKDSAHIQEFEAEWRNRKAKRSGAEPYTPLYTMADTLQALCQFKYTGYEKDLSIFDDIKIRFSDAGHLLGSSSVYITYTEENVTKTLLFSGDLGNINRPLIRDPQFPTKADYVVIESTYGDRLHGERPDYISQLSKILQETFDRGGNVVIPSFAIGRTQELLYLIRNIKQQGCIKGHDGFPVYVDSPMAVEATNVYSSGMTDYYDSETLELLEKGIDPINFEGLSLSLTSEDSKLINEDKRPKVILSASGMCEAGRIRHHLKHNLWSEKNTILFVGYQSNGTIGRKLLDGALSVKLFGEEIVVNAKIENLAGISGHADKYMLINWLSTLEAAPQKVFINHGEDTVCDQFAETVTDKLGFEAIAPYSGDTYDLLSGECIEKAPIVKVTKKSDAKLRNEAIFTKLVAAGQRLMGIIKTYKNGSNKDIARFTDRINDLCDKYDR